MKRLIILRHAKSSWDDNFLNDHSRPLNERGIVESKKIGLFMKKNNLLPDRVFSSTAQRTTETILNIQEMLDKNLSIEFRKDFYLTEPQQVINAIKGADEKIDTLLVLGHNPTMENLAGILSDNLPNEKFGTGTMVIIDFEINSWKDLNKKGRLKLFQRPAQIKDL